LEFGISRVLCIEIAGAGPPEVLVPAERPDPVPQRGEVLVRVAAAGVNRPDVMQRRGLYPPPEGASDIPGLEIAGTIVALGSGVTGWRAGDRVCALVAGGGYATLCAAPAPQCLPVPEGLDFTSAAAIPETYFTVWSNVFERGGLRAGEDALFHGGSSGIGTTAIQLASARGARVFATAGSDEKCRACEALGAWRAINYRRSDFVDVIREATDGRGVDLVLDIIGAAYTPRNLAALATDGRLVQIGLMGGEAMATVDLRRVLGRRLTITGSTLRPRTVEEKGRIAAALRREVWPLLERGAVGPVVFRTFPLSEAAAAHRLMESNEHIGKIVLTASTPGGHERPAYAVSQVRRR
jgi:putative PIG3 family NAD(P)H quinone oxidoreductase